MSTENIREKLVEYMRSADERKVKAIYTMLEDEIGTGEHDWDEAFVVELERRDASLKAGTAKTYTWEETKAMARERVAQKRRGQ